MTPTESSPSEIPSRAPSLYRRMACWLYEGILLFGVVFTAAYLFSALTQTRHALENRAAQQGFLFIVLGIYFTWFWSRGQTLAMKTWHIRLVDRLGRPVSQGRALLRYVLSWSWLLPPLIALAPFEVSVMETLVVVAGWIVCWAILSRFQPQQQFWHDAWAGTRLVNSQPRSH